MAFGIFLVKFVPTLVKLLNSFGITIWLKPNNLFVNNIVVRDSDLISVLSVTVKGTKFLLGSMVLSRVGLCYVFFKKRQAVQVVFS